jgi:hypothetical protein
MTTPLLPPDAFQQLKAGFLLSSLPGAAGGLALFLYSLKNGRLKNNKHLSKATIEVLGGLLVASFVAFEPRPLIGFGVGLTWSGVVHVVRQKITVTVRAVLSTKGADST